MALEATETGERDESDDRLDSKAGTRAGTVLRADGWFVPLDDAIEALRGWYLEAASAAARSDDPPIATKRGATMIASDALGVYVVPRGRRRFVRGDRAIEQLPDNAPTWVRAIVEDRSPKLTGDSKRSRKQLISIVEARALMALQRLGLTRAAAALKVMLWNAERRRDDDEVALLRAVENGDATKDDVQVVRDRAKVIIRTSRRIIEDLDRRD